MKDVEFLPSRCREDVAIVRSCPKALLNLEQSRRAALDEAFSRSEMHVELEELEHVSISQQ